MHRDRYGRREINENEICDLLYLDPQVDLRGIYLSDASKHDQAIKINYSELPRLAQLEVLSEDPVLWHKRNQQDWWIPDAYKEMDIAAWILAQCQGETELQRCGAELLEYAERDLLLLLCYLRYLVDTMRDKGVVWGVGRGSSVASFVLYKIGVHRINSIEYDLDFHEFMR